MDPKKFGSKKLWVQENLGWEKLSKKICPRKILGPKKNCPTINVVRNNFEFKKIWVPNKFHIQKHLGRENIWWSESLGRKEYWTLVCLEV